MWRNSIAVSALVLALAGGACGGDGGGNDVVAPLSPDAALRAAALLGSCVDDGAVSFLETLYFPYPENVLLSLRDAADCLAASDDGCAAVPRCLPIRFVTGDCVEGCIGDRIVICGDGGGHSIALPAGFSCDGAGGITVPGAPRCDGATFVQRCDGDRPVKCQGDGFEIPQGSCADAGFACVAPGGEAQAVCQGTGGACQGSSYGQGWLEGTCLDADTLETCVRDGRHVQRCADVGVGFTCQARGPGISFCGLGTECDPRQDSGDGNGARCDGDAIVVCNAGRLDHLECKTLGFAACAEVDGIPYCTPGPFPGFTP